MMVIRGRDDHKMASKISLQPRNCDAWVAATSCKARRRERETHMVGERERRGREGALAGNVHPGLPLKGLNQSLDPYPLSLDSPADIVQ